MDTQTVDLDQLPQAINNVVKSIGDRFQDHDYRPALHECAEIIRDQTRKNFDTESDPDGNPWPKWLFRRPEDPAEHPTLFITGALKASATEGPGHIENIEPRSLHYESALPYSATHQYGADIGAPPGGLIRRDGGGFKRPGELIHIPARPFLGVNEQNVEAMAEVVANAAVEGILKGD